MKTFHFKEFWKVFKNSFGIVLLMAYLFGLLVYSFIKKNYAGQGLDLDITSIIIIVVATMLVLTLAVTITYIIIILFKSKAVDINHMFPEIKQCPVFSNIDNLSFSTKEDILKWYNIVEYDVIGKKEKQLDPTSILGDDHVWLLTSDLKLELTNETLISTIRENINKGIKYTYFLPNDDHINLEIDRLNNIYGKDKINIILLDKQCKLLFDLFDVIIFDPKNDYSNAFICVDFTDPRKYRKLMDDDAKNLITKLNKEKSSI